MLVITSCTDTRYWDNLQRETTQQGVLKYCDYLKAEIKKDFSDDPAQSDKYLGMIYHIEGYFIEHSEVYSDGYENRVDSIIRNYKNINAQNNISIIDFFDSLYIENIDNIHYKYQKEYDSTLYKLYFLHQLFTTNSAINCSKGGILEIPYFWAYYNDIRPDINCVDRQRLYERTPSIYLSDLVDDQPRYNYECVGEFYTFGWCGEIEMSFSTLLNNMGFTSKVVASGNHSWTEIYIESEDSILEIDNTFNTFDFSYKRPDSKANWKQDIDYHEDPCPKYNNNCAYCLMKHHYNKDYKIDNIFVSELSSIRIKNKVMDFLQPI